MADYSSFAALANEDKASDVFAKSPYKSWVREMIKSQRMSAAKGSVRVKGVVGPASWVGADRQKPYVAYSVTSKRLEAKEIAQTSTVPEEDFMDTDVDVVEEMHEVGGESVLKGLDDSLYRATSAAGNPFHAQTPSILAGANAAGNTAVGTGNLADDFKTAAALVRADGYGGRIGFLVEGFGEEALWGLTAGELSTAVYVDGKVWGQPVFFIETSDLDAGNYKISALALEHFVLGIREDLTFKISGETALQDTVNDELITTFDHDLVAFRVKARFGFAASNDEAVTHYPAAVVSYDATP